jgi:hypothetical protein
VHDACAAVARYPDQPDQPPIRSHIYQLTCSPVHHYVPLPMKIAFRVAWSRVAERATRVLLGWVSHLPPQLTPDHARNG